MAERSIDGVDVKVATPEQLSTYAVAETQLDAFEVPKLYDSTNPNARVFFALFDGTGNDLIKDPQHMTNVGLLTRQLVEIGLEDEKIGYFYKEGPGTQGGLIGILDGATGGSYNQRIEVMYNKFVVQAAQWLKENPAVEISVIAVGFSRGAEQAAGFSRLVDERGIQDPKARIMELRSHGGRDKAHYTVPPLRAGGTVPQAVGLYDPVSTGEPALNDRRLPPSVMSGIQIKAADEYRSVFPSTSIINQGTSTDGRFLGVTTSGAHSDIGGGYELRGLSNRNFNIMANYLNEMLVEPVFKNLNIPLDPSMSVIHDSTQHKWFYQRVSMRETNFQLEPTGKKKIEVANSFMNQFVSRNMNTKEKVASIRGANFNAQELHERNRRIASLPKLEDKAGAIYSFWKLATEAINKNNGDALAVDWQKIEKATMRESIGEHGQSPQSVMEALRTYSPGSVTSSRLEAIRLSTERVAPQLQAQYEHFKSHDLGANNRLNS